MSTDLDAPEHALCSESLQKTRARAEALLSDVKELRKGRESLLGEIRGLTAKLERLEAERTQAETVRAELRRAQEIVKRYIVALGAHLAEAWREALIRECGLVEDAIGFVSVPQSSTGEVK